MIQFLGLQTPFHNDKFGALVCHFLTALNSHHSPYFQSRPEVDALPSRSPDGPVAVNYHRQGMGLNQDEPHCPDNPQWYLHTEYNRNGGVALTILHLLHFELKLNFKEFTVKRNITTKGEKEMFLLI